ncbi:MAG: ACT domain-containing protein [Thermoanaerobaculum sp.]
MLSTKTGSALIVSSDAFAVVSFPEGDVPGAERIPCGSLPLDRRTLLVPEALVPQLPPGAQVASGGWRRVEIFGPFASTELLAATTSALAEVEIPAWVFSRAQGLWFFVPEQKLGRALAALRQARLERFAQNLRKR